MPRKTRKPAADRVDVYQKVTDKILELMESDQLAPWRKPWRGGAGGRAKNLASGWALPNKP